MREGDKLIVPNIFYEKDGIRKLSSNAVKLYFQILILEDKYGGAFTYSSERFMQDLNISHNSFIKCREELIQRGYITIESKTDRDKNGTFMKRVKYTVCEE